MTIPVFWMEPTGRVRVRLRVYRSRAEHRCAAGPLDYCDAEVVIAADAPEADWREEYKHEDFPGRTLHRSRAELVPDDDPRWPTRCDACGEPMGEDATRQVWADRLYSGAPDGILRTDREWPVGALFNADWLADIPAWTGPDGIALCCVTPGGQWMVDSEASNCTRKGDRSHKCWVRHGDPRDPQGLTTGQPLHVDKHGETCAAGAGSILAGSYHGFLHHGHLTSC